MAWNAANPVPWKRLSIEWLVIGTVVALISLITTDNRELSSYLTIVFGGVIYVAFGALLAKFGYQRKTLKQIRNEAAAQPARQVGRSSAPTQTGRQKPAPTSRTGGGSHQSPPKRKR